MDNSKKGVQVKTLYQRYRFFHELAGYVVGQSAVCALALARAEETAERRGLMVLWEDEDEPWDSDCPEPTYVMWAGVYWREDDDQGRYQGRYRARRSPPLASVGMVGFNTWNDPYRRVVEAELFMEALSGEVDRLDQEAANELAARATYAGGM